MNKKITEKNKKNILDLDNLWLNLGGFSRSESNIFKEEDNFLTAKIQNSQTCSLTKLIPWEEGKVFYPYTPNIDPETHPYYCFYNNVLYICISNNPNNNIAESGNYLTKTAPSGTSALPQTLNDGYTWLSLWSLDYTKDIFLTSIDLPIPEFGIKITGSDIQTVYSNICEAGATSYGKCCLYHKQNNIDPIVGITYYAGDLMHCTVVSYCYECYNIAKALNADYSFVGEADDCPSTTTTSTLINELTKNFNNIAPNTSNGIQLQILNEYENYYEGLMSATIDLSGVSYEDRLLNKENPYLVITDPHSDGQAVVKINTAKINDQVHEAIGITIEQRGKNYVFPTWYIEGNELSPLNNVIKLQPYPQNIFTNPELLLPIIAHAVNSYISVSEIKEVCKNKSFTKFALSGPPLDRTTNAELVYAPNERIVKRTQDLITAVVLENGEIPPPLEALGGEPESGSYNEGEIDTEEPVSEEDLSELENETKGYTVFVSDISTGVNLVAGQNYGYVLDSNGDQYPGFKIEMTDLSDSDIVAADVGDDITVLGNSCRILEITKSDIIKPKEYYSNGSININNISNLNNNVNIAISLKIT